MTALQSFVHHHHQRAIASTADDCYPILFASVRTGCAVQWCNVNSRGFVTQHSVDDTHCSRNRRNIDANSWIFTFVPVPLFYLAIKISNKNIPWRSWWPTDGRTDWWVVSGQVVTCRHSGHLYGRRSRLMRIKKLSILSRNASQLHEKNNHRISSDVITISA